MRIYDTRVGRFLSVDPLTKSYAFYSPYHSAGNNPIRNKDLDGGEPLGFIRSWAPRPLFELSRKKMVDENGGFSKTINDPVLGFVDVRMVYDSWTKQNWFIHEHDDGTYYYLRNNNNRSDVLTLKGRTIDVVGGHLEPFVTQDRIQAKLGYQVADAIGVGAFSAMAAVGIGGAAIELAPSAWGLWVGAHEVPELMPYFGLLGGASAIGLKGRVQDQIPQ